MSTKFTINSKVMEDNLAKFDGRARKVIDATMKYQAAKSEAWMRTNAPWTDRTTNARNGLFGMVIDDIGENVWLLVLSHSVSYGIWLEVRNNGQYAIVRPAFLKAQRELMKRLSRIFEKMEKG